MAQFKLPSLLVIFDLLHCLLRICFCFFLDLHLFCPKFVFWHCTIVDFSKLCCWLSIVWGAKLSMTTLIIIKHEPNCLVNSLSPSCLLLSLYLCAKCVILIMVLTNFNSQQTWWPLVLLCTATIHTLQSQTISNMFQF